MHLPLHWNCPKINVLQIPWHSHLFDLLQPPPLSCLFLHTLSVGVFQPFLFYQAVYHSHHSQHQTCNRHYFPLHMHSNVPVRIIDEKFSQHLLRNVIPKSVSIAALCGAKAASTAGIPFCMEDRSSTTILFFSRALFLKRRIDISTQVFHQYISSFSLVLAPWKATSRGAVALTVQLWATEPSTLQVFFQKRMLAWCWSRLWSVHRNEAAWSYLSSVAALPKYDGRQQSAISNRMIFSIFVAGPVQPGSSFPLRQWCGPEYTVGFHYTAGLYHVFSNMLWAFSLLSWNVCFLSDSSKTLQ